MPEPPPPEPLEAIEAIEALRAGWSNYIEAAFMEPERAELLGCPASQLSWVDAESGIEVAHCNAQWQTQTFERLRDLDERHIIRTGTDRDELAMQRFNPLLDGAKRITVLDQWAGRHVAHHHTKDREGTPWLASANHELEWLLSLGDRYADAATFSLFTAYDVSMSGDSVNEKDVRDAFEDLWERTHEHGGLARFQLFLGPRRKTISGGRRKFPHDRHIRFDAGPGFILSTSLDCLRFQTTADEWKLVYVWSPADLAGLRADENTARAFTGAPQTFG
jgi:hypothetical protein